MAFRKWLRTGTTFLVGTATGIAIYYYEQSKSNELHASWTTNFEPSVKWDNNWDRREPVSLVKPPKNDSEKEIKDLENELKKQTATASRHLILIRHGQYQTEADEDKNRILTALGRQQAEFTGQRLKDMGLQYLKLTCSTMARAQETADIIHKYIPHIPRDQSELLREGAPIPPEPPIGSWRPEKHQFFQDGARIEAAFRKYFHRADPSQTEDSHEIIVCHANVIRYFVCRSLQFPPEGWLRISLNHASLTWITIRPSGRVSIRMLGEAGFMPLDKVSVL